MVVLRLLPSGLTGIGLVLLGLLSFRAPAQDPPPAAPAPNPPPAAAPIWESVDPLPRRFPRFTDTNGCRWGLEQDGSLALSGSGAQPRLPLVNHAARLTVNGQAFAPATASVSPDSSRLRLTGAAHSLTVVRDIWIDRERGGTRWADTLTNPGSTPVKVVVAHAAKFDQPVPALHRADGAPLADNATEAREGAIAFLQNQPEGMSSAVFLVADPKGKAVPRWRGKKNGDAHQFDWSLEVPPGGSTTLVSWIIQRPALDPEGIKAAIEPFTRGGRLIRPRLEAAAIGTLANFPDRGLSAEDGGADGGDPADVLAALERFTESLGVARGEADVYFMNAKSVLEGTVTGGALELDSRYGAVAVPLEQVAAIQGGGGRGRRPRVFLRDGHVLHGAVRLPDWKIAGDKGWAITLNPDTLEALVLRTAATDGASAPPPNFLAQLTSGETLPLRFPAETALGFATPWGELPVTAGDLAGLWRLRVPTPSSRLSLRDGTRLTVLPVPREITGTSARFGPVPLMTTDLAALWSPGAEAPDPEGGEEEIASLGDLEEAPAARALLRGSSVLAARLAGPALTLVSSGSETRLNADEIIALERAEGSSDLGPRFTVKLAGGASFEGTLPSAGLDLQLRTGPVWTVPLSHFLGWKQAALPEPR